MDSIDEIISESKKGTEKCVEEITLVGKRIAVTLTSLINMLHVEKIIIGGKLAQSDLPLLDEIQKQVNSQSFLAKKRKVVIGNSLLGDNVGVIGAASIALLYGLFSADRKFIEKG